MPTRKLFTIKDLNTLCSEEFLKEVLDGMPSESLSDLCEQYQVRQTLEFGRGIHFGDNSKGDLNEKSK